jgi:gliding motility-associated-like protein
VDYALDASPAFAIDVNTGLLTGTATDEGRYVIGIVCEEWRDGVLLGEHYRDFQFNVELCEPTIVSLIGVEGEVVEDYYLDCDDFLVNFNNFSEGADDYMWLFGDGTTSTTFEPSHVFPDTGVYIVSLICNPGFVCADTFTTEIWIYNTLTANFSFNAGCSGEAVIFSDNSISTEAGDIVEWDWDFGDGGSSTSSDPTHAYDIGGIYDVILTVTTDKGCSSTVILPVDLLSGPTADYSVDDVCLNEAAEFIDETTHPAGVTLTNWWWDFGDGNSSSDQDPSYFFEEAGDYDVTLIVATDNDCQDTITQSITIGELPYPYAGLDDTVTYLEYYTLTGEGNGTYSWSPAGLVSDPFIATPQIRPEVTTTYILTVTSPDGCVAIDSVTIYVEDITIVEIPNAFSPNNDGINDQFFVLTHTVAEFYEFSIYNRWGQLLFTTSDPTFGWDGTYNDVEQDVGAYVYVVRAKDISGDLVNLQGSFMLLK